MRLRPALLAFCALCLVSTPAFPQRPGRDVSLPPTAVKDTFFAYVLGIITAGLELDVDNAQMREILTEFKTTLSLPFDLIRNVSQHAAGATGVRTIVLDFQSDVSIPIPFSLLFYHPGSIQASQDLSFQVNEIFPLTAAAGGSPDAFDLVLTHGSVLVDIDDWLEALLRAYMEDTWIHHLVFFIWQGDWIGMLEGAGSHTGRTLRAYFDFTRNKIVFPVPGALESMGKKLVPDVTP